ncbi:hypothetical protein SpCBS45565_g01345 [Spizellomyces sp. 'palustris']|nr:hypothetical protein SpCBS45565_g01345 [Spizellomyces sp. 'palustris']
MELAWFRIALHGHGLFPAPPPAVLAVRKSEVVDVTAAGVAVLPGTGTQRGDPTVPSRGREVAPDLLMHDVDLPVLPGDLVKTGLENPTPSKVLGVFGLSLHTQEEDLERLFSTYGRIESCKIIYDHWTRKSRGFGFITFAEVEGATAARQELNGTFLHDRPMRVDFSLTQRPHSPTPGRYMGRDLDRGGSRSRGGYRRDYDDRDRDHRRRREPSYSPRRRRSPSPYRRRRSPSVDSR